MDSSSPESAAQTSFQVLLPSHSHSLTVSLPTQATIADLKSEIFDKCAGRPRPHGQRVIWKGRVLADGEVVGEVMESSGGPHTVHLAVHPSAWTSAPPHSMVASTPGDSTTFLPSTTTPPQPDTHLTPTPTSTPPGFNYPQLQLPHLYLHYLHTNALRLLSGESALPWTGLVDIQSSRSLAKDAVTRAGFGWAPELDDELPQPEAGIGAKYQITFMGNLPYLVLTDPTASPSASQIKALQILSYTFPLLPLAPALSSFLTTPREQNAPQPVPVNNTRPARRILFEVNIPGQAILPIVLHIVRASFFVYFFTPVQRPLWLTAVVAWVCWEAYGIVRQGNEQIRAQREQGGARPAADAPPNAAPNAGPNAGPQQQDGPAGAPQQPARNITLNLNARTTVFGAMDRIALLNLESEEQILDLERSTDLTQRRPQPASTVWRLFSFVLLFFATLFPAVWDRRQTRLRRREAKVKEIYGAGRPRPSDTRQTLDGDDQQQEASGPAEGERRRTLLQPWIRRYVEDVLNGEIVEEGEL